MLPALRDAPNLNALFAGLAVEEIIRNGVEWFVVCPGSRSAPLAWAVASHPQAKCVVHHDERGAAFHTLGIAKGTGKPAAFICTSGTAVANALPAVVEASQSGVPMILLTADRPPHLQDAGANQTIQQTGIYGKFVRREYNFVVDATACCVDEVLTAIDDACARAACAWPGPVHLNCMMDEPLGPEPPKAGVPEWRPQLAPIAAWMESPTPYAAPESKPAIIEDDLAKRVEQAISRASRGLVLLGQLSAVDHAAAREILERLAWPALPDVTSGFRLRASSLWARPYAIHDAKRLIASADVLIHLGGPITSRRVLDAVARFGGEYLRVSPAPGGLDPYRNVSLRLPIHLAGFRLMLESSAKNSPLAEWLSESLRAERAAPGVLESAFADGDAASEPGVAYRVSRGASADSIVFVGNSMPIRDMDLFGHAGPGGPWVEANRGASGIDGNIATAAGIARATGKPVTAVIGDLAALHDLNSLALVRDLQTPFVVVVQNNDGGGIFSLLPIAKHREHFERFFGTPHGLGFEHAAAMYGLPYHRPKTNGEFTAAYGAALGHAGATVIEVRTDRVMNAARHRELDATMRAAVDCSRG